MTLKTKMSLLVFLTSLSIVSIGFSSWSITAETNAELGGNIEVGHNVTIGYFDQQIATKVSDKSILQDYMETYPFLTNQEARKDLGAFMFSGADVDKKLNILYY